MLAGAKETCNLIFDNDAATDDIVALLLLASLPKVNLVAVTITGTGEAHSVPGAANMASLLKYLNLNTVPVAYGTEKPLGEDFVPFPDWLRQIIDKRLTEKNIPMDPNPTVREDAVDLMKEVINSYLAKNQQVTILATGPLTNIAELIQKFPEVKKGIEKIVIMGGALRVPGNVKALHPEITNTVAECNIVSDPLAAQMVLKSGVPITLVPLDACNQIPMTMEYYNSLKNSSNPDHQFMYLLMKDIYDNKGEDFLVNEFYLWDPLAALICLNSDIAICETLAVEVDLKSGQTIIQEQGEHKIQAAMLIPHAELILTMLTTLIGKRLTPEAPKSVSDLDTPQTYTPSYSLTSETPKEEKPALLVEEQKKSTVNLGM